MALLGASGCGKSMTLKCIAGVETPDKGKIILNNRTLFDSEKGVNLLPRDRKVGLLFQNYALFPNMTLEQNIAIAVPKNHPNKKKSIKQKIMAFSLEGLENNYPHQLSGGQQQRVALARMLVNEPEIVMLDEPFSALDEHLRWKMEQELISILKEHKGSALYVSHNKDEVFRISDRIAVLNNGIIESIDEKQNLLINPKNINTAILTGCRNISKAKKIDEHTIYAIDWDLELKSNKIIKDNIKYVGVHNQDISFSSSYEFENIFELKIVNKIQNLFSYTLVLSNIRNNPNKTSNHLLYMEISQNEYIKNDFINLNSLWIKFTQDNLLLLY